MKLRWNWITMIVLEFHQMGWIEFPNDANWAAQGWCFTLKFDEVKVELDNNDHIGISSNGLNWVSKWCKLSSTKGELPYTKKLVQKLWFQQSFLYSTEGAILSSRLLITWSSRWPSSSSLESLFFPLRKKKEGKINICLCEL